MSILIWIVATAITLAITFAIIRAAVRAALSDHYKIVKHYETSGKWYPSDGSWRNALEPVPNEPPAPLKWWQR